MQINDDTIIRPAAVNDLVAMHALFRESVRQTCARNYSPLQLEAWIARATPERWKELFQSGLSFFIAEISETNTMAGFTAVNTSGYLHSLFVEPRSQHRGVAKMLLREAEIFARLKGATHLFSEVSITARPFFEYMGYKVEKEQTVIVNRISMINFAMYKRL